MSKSNVGGQSSISKAQSLDEIADYWDTHSLDDHWDQTHEVDFEVRASRKYRVPIDPEVYSRLEAEARARGLQPETLVNLWLVERLSKTAEEAKSNGARVAPAAGDGGAVRE